MILVKTLAGQQAFRERSATLNFAQRTAFILCDGKRRVQEVLEATASIGVTRSDLQAIIDQGLLRQANEVSKNPVDQTEQQRYLVAYPIAVELTASMGLRGFRLNLALESAQNCEELVALLPKISAMVGVAKCAKLRQALLA